MGLEIKEKAALGHKTPCPRSPKAKGGLLAHSQPVSRSVLGPCTQSKPPESEGVQAPSLPYPCCVSLYPACIAYRRAGISTPPPTVTVPTAASTTVILTSSGQARPIPTV